MPETSRVKVLSPSVHKRNEKETQIEASFMWSWGLYKYLQVLLENTCRKKEKPPGEATSVLRENSLLR